MHVPKPCGDSRFCRFVNWQSTGVRAGSSYRALYQGSTNPGPAHSGFIGESAIAVGEFSAPTYQAQHPCKRQLQTSAPTRPATAKSLLSLAKAQSSLGFSRREIQQLESRIDFL